MLSIGALNNGIVLDHIEAGKAMEIYRYLDLDNLDCGIAIIKNAQSNKMDRKDIIKIDEEIDLNLDVLGYIDADITINIIKDGKRSEKKHLELPETVKNVIKCRNPRCITSTEQEIDQIFKLADRENRIYRCIYCESRAKEHEED